MAENPPIVSVAACPNCGASLPEKATSCPQCATPIAAAPSGPGQLTPGQKIAAVVLIVNALANLAETFVMKDASSSSPIHSVLISLVIGIYILSGKPKAGFWAKLSRIVGAG